MNKQEKTNIINSIEEELQEYIKSNDKINSYLIRFHRLYLDGSYGDINNTRNGGEAVYQKHIRRYKERTLKEETFKTEAITTFKYFLIIEFFNREYLITNTEVEYILKNTLKKNYKTLYSMRLIL